MFIFDAIAILLVFIWLCLVGFSFLFALICSILHNVSHAFRAQGVVIKPTLAIPYFTGVAAFIGNIISLAKSLQNWQDTIMNKVLDELAPLLFRFKSVLVDGLQIIIDDIGVAIKVQQSGVANKAQELLGVAQQQVGVDIEAQKQEDKVTQNTLANIANNDSLPKVQEKLLALQQFIQNDDVKAAVATASGMASGAVSALQSVTRPSASGGMTVENGLSSAKDQVKDQANKITAVTAQSFRKLQESEMVTLLRSLWTSIRYLACATCPCIMFVSFTLHSQRGTWPFRTQYHHYTLVIVNPSRLVPLFHLCRHRRIFNWHRSLHRDCQCWAHYLCRSR